VSRRSPQYQVVAAGTHSDRGEGGKMKAVRTHEYRIDGYGTVMFIRTHLGSGHYSFKVFWRRAGEEKGTRIAWIQEGRKPAAKLALFYCKMACSLEDGLTSTITTTKV